MATITKRTNPSGDVVYRAQVRVKREGYPPYSESRTFSKKSLATEWAKRREFEIESNPDLLFNDGSVNYALRSGRLQSGMWTKFGRVTAKQSLGLLILF